MIKNPAWGYIPSKGLKNMILKVVGHPHPNGRVRAKIVRSLIERKKTIDLGCGEGIFCFELKKRGYDIDGIDLSLDALIHAKKNFKKFNLNINVVNASVAQMPLKDKSFQQAICLDVLEHVDNPDKVLKEIKKILVENGNLIITIPNELYLFKTILPFDYSGILKAIGHKHPGFNLHEIKKLLNKAGFKIIEYKYYHKFFSRLISEFMFAIMGEKGFKKSREKMYEHSWFSIISFILIYSFDMLDFILPHHSKGAFIAVKARKLI